MARRDAAMRAQLRRLEGVGRDIPAREVLQVWKIQDHQPIMRKSTKPLQDAATQMTELEHALSKINKSIGRRPDGCEWRPIQIDDAYFIREHASKESIEWLRRYALHLENVCVELAQAVLELRVEKACVLCDGKGAYDYTKYDTDTGMWDSGRSVCPRCRGAGKEKVE